MGLGNITDAFKRNLEGFWTCVCDVTLEEPGGRMQVAAGATFYRELARYLEAHAKSATPPGG